MMLLCRKNRQAGRLSYGGWTLGLYLCLNWKIGQLLNCVLLTLAARNYTLNAVRYTLEKVLNYGFSL